MWIWIIAGAVLVVAELITTSLMFASLALGAFVAAIAAGFAEKDALIGSIIELGKIVNIPTPHIDAVFACISLLNKSVQDVNGQLRITKP